MTYVVRPGDTLFSIANRFGISLQALLAANPSVQPGFVYVGQVLTIPTGAPGPFPPGPPVPPVPPFPPAGNVDRRLDRLEREVRELERTNREQDRQLRQLDNRVDQLERRVRRLEER